MSYQKTQTDWAPYECDRDALGGDDLGAWLERTGESAFAQLLTDRKAIVFRGFEIAPQDVNGIFDLILPRRLAYVHGNTPRTKVGANLYTSTEYPSEFTISMHGEMSYANSWPARLAFYCEKASEMGGATPVVDSRLWLQSLDSDVREAFAGGLLYYQNLHDGFGLGKSWQDTFETDVRAEVDEFLAGTDAEWDWGDGVLRIKQRRAATVEHPQTGDEVWFNQADQWHPAGLDDETAAEMCEILEEDELPQNVTFADGQPIPADVIQHVRERGLAAAVDVEWRPGDVLVVDNVAVAHGRRPYAGERRVLVAMCD
ncbi:TauD/TfdA family dioxygenase [Rhodococcus sp. IEGM 1381]|uniref:TauD/TfdA family dioxygenase n=1 Tax=Rhodococcus sp. IEGM 1381 TaxID=3047085 RepID=UPI0024B76CAE|nr:TauD/TfdA family dioxygenase [Rhodococcus sp. IEGM 1381]MDI9894484.1 TauD/TfdA family dioxygenase [Rhodococcus sp. IEGM 1381]